jgi:hypothetical protein
MAMTERVIPNGVPGGGNGAHQRRLALHAFADCEERGVHARLRKHVEDLRRPARIRTVVEREIDVTLSLFRLRISASRVSQYKRGSALPRSRMRAAGANTLVSKRK